MESPYIRLLLIIFLVALFAKGAAIFPGFSVDDYPFEFKAEFKNYFSQGRYILAAIVWIIDSLGANITDLYFSLGIVTLFLQAALVVSILRFVGMATSPTAGLVGGIMVAHPYLTESLTFRMGMPAYCVALIFSIIALEIIIKNPTSWRTRAFALLATFTMLLTYQILLNYFSIAIIFAFFFGQISQKGNDQSFAVNNVYRERAITLAIISVISTIAFLAIVLITKTLGLTTMTGRASVIDFNMLPERITQISSSLTSIYWSSEPVFPGWLKKLVALMLVISIVIIFWRLLTEKCNKNRINNIFFVVCVFLLIIPISPGVIIAFKDWWPVPRVIAHVAIIIGLIFLLADSCIQDSRNRFLKSTIFVFRIIILIGFVFLSNQILADQQRLNRWDDMMANRIISRLEIQSNFRDIRFIHINGGTYSHPARLRTMQGDMNISALYPTSSKIHLLSHVSGYKFEEANGPKIAFANAYCEARQPWPHAESVTIDNDLAIICLKK